MTSTAEPRTAHSALLRAEFVRPNMIEAPPLHSPYSLNVCIPRSPCSPRLLQQKKPGRHSVLLRIHLLWEEWTTSQVSARPREKDGATLAGGTRSSGFSSPAHEPPPLLRDVLLERARDPWSDSMAAAASSTPSPPPVTRPDWRVVRRARSAPPSVRSPDFFTPPRRGPGIATAQTTSDSSPY